MEDMMHHHIGHDDAFNVHLFGPENHHLGTEHPLVGGADHHGLVGTQADGADMVGFRFDPDAPSTWHSDPSAPQLDPGTHYHLEGRDAYQNLDAGEIDPAYQGMTIKDLVDQNLLAKVDHDSLMKFLTNHDLSITSYGSADHSLYIESNTHWIYY